MLSMAVSAQTRSLPASFREWLKTDGLLHATVSLDVVRLPRTAPQNPPTQTNPALSRGQVIYSYDADRLMIPASVLKLLTAATCLRVLGPDYQLPDSVALLDTAAVALPGLEHYNRDWLIEDIGEDYMPPLENLLPDSGRVLKEVLAETLAESLNLQAETLCRLITPSCRLDSALLVTSQYWKRRGLDTESLVQYDGCGLSPSDRVTARFVTSLLADMQFDEAFRESLPVAGRNGTVSNFLRNSRLAGRASLKTGTLKSAVNYAGYVQGSDNRTYAVCILVNNASAPRRILRKDIEKLLLSLIP